MLLACAVASLALAVPVSAAAASLEAVHRAAGAADAAALAAADAASGWVSGWVSGDPCALAGEVVAAAGGDVAECAVDEANGQVRVSVRLQTMLGTAQARARAGPPLP